jgi:transposase InsO family protein
VTGVITGNGNCYRSHLFAAACAGAGLRHIRTRPCTPRTNGEAERFIQSGLREWAYAQPYTDSAERQVALGHWLHHYNTQRPHTALAGCPPALRLRQILLLGSTEETVASSRPTLPIIVGSGRGKDRRRRPATAGAKRPVC